MVEHSEDTDSDSMRVDKSECDINSLGPGSDVVIHRYVKPQIVAHLRIINKTKQNKTTTTTTPLKYLIAVAHNVDNKLVSNN